MGWGKLNNVPIYIIINYNLIIHQKFVSLSSKDSIIFNIISTKLSESVGVWKLYKEIWLRLDFRWDLSLAVSSLEYKGVRFTMITYSLGNLGSLFPHIHLDPLCMG